MLDGETTNQMSQRALVGNVVLYIVTSSSTDFPSSSIRPGPDAHATFTTSSSPCIPLPCSFIFERTMVVVVDWSDHDDHLPDADSFEAERGKARWGLLEQQGRTTEPKENPNVNTFSAALLCYPYVSFPFSLRLTKESTS